LTKHGDSQEKLSSKQEKYDLAGVDLKGVTIFNKEGGTSQDLLDYADGGRDQQLKRVSIPRKEKGKRRRGQENLLLQGGCG